ncbi:hypothetical protein ACH4D5_35150 [Streptomyces sp. NPDC018029]|uniref:hypothetical protein n=1 Tax=Streptomyces sp. NPDC018029 TaxID=3365032 RepID=UPI0037B809BA
MRTFQERCTRYSAALVLPVLLGAVACGGGSGDAEDRADAKKGARASQGVKAGGAADRDRPAALKAMALTDADVGARHRIRALNNGVAAAYGKAESSATPARCRPLDQMLSYSSSPQPKAFHPYSVIEKGSTYTEPKGTELVVGLAAHDTAGAKKVMAGLREAVAKCGSGFESAKGTYGDVEDWPAQGLGDDAVAYVLQGGVNGESASARYTVIRSGSTVVTFQATNLEAPWELTGPDLDLIDAQLDRVTKAQAGA